MYEGRNNPQEEILSSDYWWDRSINRAKGDWKRLASRHGGKPSAGFANMTYADGHAAQLSYAYATQETSSGLLSTQTGYGTAVTNVTTGDVNKYSNCIWVPFGKANN